MKPLTPQTQKLGKYVLMGKIAMGGMAELYRAKITGEEGFEKILAIKKVLPHLLHEKALITAFTDEARLAAMLDHPNIIQIYDFGIENDQYFIAMELLQGHDLSTILKHLKQNAETLPLATALFITAKICTGLHYAHSLADPYGKQLNIIHRDINPANIFITSEGVVKIIDFGIARAASHNRATVAGSMMGKIRYMSPEQAEGKDIDYRVDVYAIGALLYEMLAGRPLFQGEMMAVLAQVKSGDYEPLEQISPDFPAEIYAIINQALALSPEKRFQSCEALLDAIEACLHQCDERLSGRSLASWLSSLTITDKKSLQHLSPPLSSGQDETIADITEHESPEPERPRRVALKPQAETSRFPLLQHLWQDKRTSFLVVAGLILASIALFFFNVNKQYTAYNIWLHTNSNYIKCVNYKNGTSILPAGSRVQNLQVNHAENTISFDLEDESTLTIHFTPKWHPGKTISDYAKMIVSTDSLQQLTAGMNKSEVAAIKTATTIAGMSKEAVIVSYGYPPEHVTQSLTLDEWTYWQTTRKHFNLCFDDDEKMLETCPGEEQDQSSIFKKFKKLMN